MALYRDDIQSFGQGYVGAMLAAKQMGLERERLDQQKRYQDSLMKLNEAQARYYEQGGSRREVKAQMFTVPQLDDIQGMMVNSILPRVKEKRDAKWWLPRAWESVDYMIDPQDEAAAFQEVLTMFGGEGLSQEQTGQLKTIFDSVLMRGETEGFTNAENKVVKVRRSNPTVIGPEIQNPVPGQQRKVGDLLQEWQD